jgi:hypothetical protein
MPAGKEGGEFALHRLLLLYQASPAFDVPRDVVRLATRRLISAATPWPVDGARS